MIKVVVCARAELVKIQGPLADRYGQANLVLLISLAVQRKEGSARAGGIKNVRRDGIQRRRLIVAAIGAAKNPVQPRDLNGDSKSRAGIVLAHQSGKMRETHTGIEGQP